MKKGYYVISLIALVLIGGAFYGGYQYGMSKIPTRGAGNFAGAMRTGAGGRFGGAGGANASAVRGSILSKDASTITLQLSGSNAGSKIVLYSDTTPITKTATGTTSDLQTGQNIMVAGTANSDGSVTAESIQLVPATGTPRGF